MSDIVTEIFGWLGMPTSIQSLLIFIALLISLKAGLVFYAMRLVADASADISHDLRTRLVAAYAHAQWSFFTSLPIGRAANSIATEAQRAGQCFLLMGKTIATAFQSFVYLAIATSLSWEVSLLSVVVGAVAVIAFRRLIGWARQAGENMTASFNTLLTALSEALVGIKPLKAMRREIRFIEKISKESDRITIAQKQQNNSALLLVAFHEPLKVFVMAICLLIAYSSDQLTLPILLMLAFLFMRLLSAMNSTQSHYQNTVMFESALWSMVAGLEQAEKSREGRFGTERPSLDHGITFDNISIDYDGSFVIRDFSDHIPCNALTMILGPSGAGKSSLIDIILRFKQPSDGTILVDSTSLTTVDINYWREQVGYVPQEIFLFHDTIYENVTLGDSSVKHSDVESALKRAGAWDFVIGLPDRLGTVVGERGGRLSGGQRQRIVLARALVMNPLLLILDEATSALDKDSEHSIFETLQAISRDTTVIVISHNSQVVEFASHVIKLEG